MDDFDNIWYAFYAFVCVVVCAVCVIVLDVKKFGYKMNLILRRVAT